MKKVAAKMSWQRASEDGELLLVRSDVVDCLLLVADGHEEDGALEAAEAFRRLAGRFALVGVDSEPRDLAR